MFCLEQEIVHDADCIEILRCLPNMDDFKIAHLHCLKNLDSEVVQAVVDEAKLFISIVDRAPFKEAIDNVVDEPLILLYQAMDYLDRVRQQVPTISGYLKRIAEEAGWLCITAYCLTPDMERAIDAAVSKNSTK